MPLVETSTSVPGSFVAGDTVRMTLTYAAYSAATHSLQLVLTHHDEREVGLKFDATANGTAYDVTLTSAQTTTMLPGAWVYDIVLTEDSSNDTRRVDGGTLSVNPRPGHVREKSFNEQMVELLESYLSGNVAQGHESWTLRGQSFARMSMSDANSLLNEYRNKVRVEKANDRARRGLKSGMTGQIRFTSA